MTDDHPAAPGSAGPEPTASGPATPGSAADAVFRRALRDVAILLGALLVLGLVVGGLLAGAPGVWGALIGWGLAVVFSTTTIVAMIRTSRSSPAAMAGVVMGTWLAKVVVVVVVLAVLRPLSFYSAPVLGAVLAIAVIGSAVLDYRAVTTGRVPYVEPGGR
ncbi:MAG: hypothetical protein FWF28_05885 [Micrococcales bacterium]|nr:hypothetical protein [Micrococcales bacterium]